MKNVNPLKSGIALLVGVIALITIGGCSKTYNADLNNDYANAKPIAQGTTEPAIVNFTPVSGPPNTVITIFGTNFNNTPANNKVTINGVPATVNEVTSTTVDGIISTEIKVTVPANATTGKIALTTGSTTVTTASNFKVFTGTLSTFFNLGTTAIKHIVADTSGNVYGEDGAKTIYKISANGAVSTVAGGPGTNTFNSLFGITLDAFGSLYVPDRGNFNVYRITPDAVVSVFAGNGLVGYKDDYGNAAQFATPMGIVKGPSGNFYVTDSHRVRKITSSGLVTTFAGSSAEGNIDGTGTAARFGNLAGIAVDAGGNLYVSDTEFLNIRKITPAGVVTTLAGSGIAGFVDGPGAAAQFTYPQDLAVDASGNVLVTDKNPLLPIYTVRMINRLGNVSTLLKGTSNTGVINGALGIATVNAPDGMAIDNRGNIYIVNTGAGVISKLTYQ